MRFLLDVNVPLKLAWEFERLGHQCEHVSKAIDKNAKDRQIAEFANQHSLILVSKDADFVEFSNSGLFKGQLIRLRCGNMGTRDTCMVLRRALPSVLAAFETGRKIVEIYDRPPTPQNPLG